MEMELQFLTLAERSLFWVWLLVRLDWFDSNGMSKFTLFKASAFNGGGFFAFGRETETDLRRPN
jgi:hypothetical protein